VRPIGGGAGGPAAGGGAGGSGSDLPQSSSQRSMQLSPAPAAGSPAASPTASPAQPLQPRSSPPPSPGRLHHSAQPAACPRQSSPPGRAAAQPWADYSSVFTAAKAGMQGVDQDHVKKVVYEMSKDSAHFRNEQRKQTAVQEKIGRLRARAAALSHAELAGHARAADARAVALEARRDLSRSWLHVDMDVSAGPVWRLNTGLLGPPGLLGPYNWLCGLATKPWPN
jgi:hypothetical protein